MMQLAWALQALKRFLKILSRSARAGISLIHACILDVLAINAHELIKKHFIGISLTNDGLGA